MEENKKPLAEGEEKEEAVQFLVMPCLRKN